MDGVVLKEVVLEMRRSPPKFTHTHTHTHACSKCWEQLLIPPAQDPTAPPAAALAGGVTGFSASPVPAGGYRG